MAIGQLTNKSVEKYLNLYVKPGGRITKAALRQAVRAHADELEFTNLGLFGGTYFRLREVAALPSESSVEVRTANGELLGCIYWQASAGSIQYVVS